jgi:RNA polymerase sigma-70 factor (ECF subfamily)
MQEPDVPGALARARAGHQDGFEVLWRAWSPRVAGYVRGQGPDIDVDEVVSQAFLEVFAALPGVDGGPEALLGLLMTVARRRAVDGRRSAGRRRRLAELDEARRTHPSAEEETVERQAHERLRDLLSVLPADQREVLLLRAFGDLTIESIAEHMGRSVGATKALQRRGLVTLRRHPELLDAMGLRHGGEA